MSEAEIWICPQCQTSVDISEQGFMTEIMCPGCGMVNTVHTVLHNFRLERVLGVGGMSIVLQARDLVLNRTLAIKLLKDSYRSDPERIARFEKECALMAKVRHPNVVSVYSAGAANGQFYIAMELVEGTNLEHMVSPMEPMAPLKALSIVRQVAKGLSAANKAGLLHRDIKPGNVLVTRTGRAKVLDFGLSLGKADADTEETIWATPFYVPPETLLREPEDVRTDIYALGMTLRFLLSGCETFSNMPQTPEELLNCKRLMQPIRSRDYGIDEAYADLVNHMTAYDINARPTGYIDLLQELEEVHEAQRAYEVAHSPAGRAKQRIRRRIYSLCVFVLGLLFMWLTSIVCQPTQKYDAVVFSEHAHDAQKDALLLKAAEDALGKKQWSESVEKFMLLANQASDSTMGAWGSCVAFYISVLDGAGVNSAEAADAMEQFNKRITTNAPISPAGSVGAANMRAIRRGMHDDKVELPDSKVARQEVMNALLHFSQFMYFAFKDNKVEMQVHQEKAIELFELTEEPYSHLATLLKKCNTATLQKQLAAQAKEEESLDDASKDSNQCYTISRRNSATNIIQAQDSASSSAHRGYVPLDAEDSSLYGQRRKEVVAEMRKVSESIDAMLKRKFLSEYRPGMNDADKLKLVAKIKNPQLLEEVRTLYHLLAGEVDEAAKSNPHKDTPESSAPFAVLAQRWILATAQSEGRNFPHKKIVLVSPKGICWPKQQETNRLSSGIEAAIVAHSDYGMTLEIIGEGGEPKLVDYKRMYNDVYCEMPTANESGVWIDVADTGWRGPCYLVKNTFIHPLSSMKHDAATVIHRDANNLHIRWNNDEETVRYVRYANGMYLRDKAPDHITYPLVDEKGVSHALVYKRGGGTRLREAIYQTHHLTYFEDTSKTIIIKRGGSAAKEVFELAEDGIFYQKRTSPAKSPLTYIEWMFLKNAGVRGVRINPADQTLTAKFFGKERVAEVLNAKEDEICIKWKDTNEKETFRRMPCGGFVTTNFPEGTKLFSIIDYKNRGTYAVIPKSPGQLLSASRYNVEIETVEANDKKLTLIDRGEKITYICNGKGLYIREDSPDGTSCIREFECPGRWRSYVGIQDNSAVHFFNPGFGTFADIVNKTDDSYTLYWKTYKTTETFRKKPGTNVYVLEDQKNSVSSTTNTRIWYADAFTQVEAELTSGIDKTTQLRISPKYGEFKAEVMHFDDKKMVLQWEDAYFTRNRALSLNDESRIEVREKRRANVTYTKRPDGCYTVDDVEFADGAECEVVTMHNRMWVGPVTIHKGINKAWRMTPRGNCQSADVLAYDGNKLILKWHRWQETRYTRDSQGVYRQDPGDKGETTFIHRGNKSFFLYIEGNEARACHKPHALAEVGTIIEKTANSMRVRWMMTGNEETFEKDSKGEYHKK